MEHCVLPQFAVMKSKLQTTQPKRARDSHMKLIACRASLPANNLAS